MITLLIAAALLLILILSWIILLKDKNSYNIPGPTPLPLIGNGHLFVTRRTRHFDDPNMLTLFITSSCDASPLLKNFFLCSMDFKGDAVRVHLFHDPYVLLYHPKYIEPLISSTELITKGKSYTYLLDWLGFGLLTSTGHRWHSHRKFLTPAFHFNILQNFLPVFIKNEKILINKLRKSYCDEKSFDLFPIIALTALDNITESIMGVSFNTQENSNSNYVKSIETLSQIIALKMRNPFVAEEAIFRLTPYKKSHDEAIKILHGHTKKVLAIRKEELKQANIDSLPENTEFGIRNKHAFLDLLLLSKIDGKRIDEEAVREEVDTFMFEGHDTTTSGITFALFCLSKHRDVQEKVLQEQRDIYNDDLSKDPIYSDLKKMKYLEKVIRESLRLYPSVPLFERMITKDSELAGLKIKKNTSVIMDIFHMQRHPDLYDNPLEFRPERFDSQANAARNPFAWLAFSAGPRNCIGQKFAMMEMKVVIAAVVKSFKILPSDIEPALCSDLILRSKNGVKIKLIPRIK